MKRKENGTMRLEDTAVGKRLVVMLAAAILTTEPPTPDPDPAPAPDPAPDPSPDPDPAPDPSPDPTPAADDLKDLFQPEEVEARRTEATRRAALSDEERTAEDTAKAEEVAKNAIPEEYADFAVAEGVVLDPEMIAEFKPMAKALGLSQEKAQTLVDLAAKVQQRTIEGIFAQHEERKATWLTEAQADEEIGADIKKWNPEIPDSAKDSIAVRAFNTIADNNPKLKAAVDELGIGNHPEFLRMFYRIGSRMREDTFDLGGDGRGDKSVASTLWPDLK